jgi:hypothetical protein
MAKNTVAIAQVGNLLTSPVFVTALVGLVAEVATALGVKVLGDAGTQAQLIAMITGVGTMLAHWATGNVSISSGVVFPQAPQQVGAGLHTVEVVGPPAPPVVPPPSVTVSPLVMSVPPAPPAGG